jgi:hypothetical protein
LDRRRQLAISRGNSGSCRKENGSRGDQSGCARCRRAARVATRGTREAGIAGSAGARFENQRFEAGRLQIRFEVGRGELPCLTSSSLYATGSRAGFSRFATLESDFAANSFRGFLGNSCQFFLACGARTGRQKSPLAAARKAPVQPGR